MERIENVIKVLEEFAPKDLQENYDNCGLLVGDRSTELKGVLACLDCTEDVVNEAITKGCNLIVAHHPILFSGLKRINGNNYIERTIIKAIKNDIAIYAIHTNLDNVANGVNFKIAEILGLNNIQILKPKSQTLQKLTTFVPNEYLEKVATALHEAGAGQIGNYKDCSFRIEGIGTFTPNEHSQPFSGEKNVKSFEKETRLEVIFPSHVQSSIIATLYDSHPYEEIAYYLHGLENTNQEIGSGATGQLMHEMPITDFLDHLKRKMQLKVMKHTHLCKNHIKKVAVCGGSGSFLLKDAVRSKADVFITSDFKYHDFFDAENQIIVIDIGHYESEIFTKDLICDVIRKKIANIAVILSETNTNPINYY